ncbi:MAG: hypothetical protein LUO95_00225 [Methylococcaceae bacterium]|nr:hypothetical protein [Methylococcaceae bacterium]
MKFNHCPVLFLLILLSVGTDIAMADSLSSWSLKGFGTLAATGTDTDKIGFYRDKSQTQDANSGWGITNDSQLGLQVDWQASDSLHATLQWIARDHAGNFFEQNLDWAFLRWSLGNDLDIRLGRLGVGVFSLSDYRNIGYTYPWIRPPHEVYSTIPYYHFDGADITKKFSLGEEGILSVKIYGGYSFNQLPTQTAGVHNQQSPATGANISYENGNWQARLGYTYATITSNPPIQDILTPINSPAFAQAWPDLKQIIPEITMRGKAYHFGSVGLAYDDSIWLAQMEAVYIGSNILWSPPRTSAYLSLGRRFSTVTLYSLLGIAKSFQHNIDVPDPLIANPALLKEQQRLSNVLNNTAINEQSISIGTRWDFYENMALKTQWDHYWLGKNNGPQQWQQSVGESTPNTVNVMSVSIDFIF